MSVVIGWASAWHANCFEKSHPHGRWLMALMESRPESDALYDASGASIGLVSDDSEDVRDETGEPLSCDYCLGYVVPDERAPDSPLAQDIINLSEEYRMREVTQLLSACAQVARDWDTSPSELRTRMVNTLARATMPDGYTEQAWLAVGTKVWQLTIGWCQTWNNREIIHLQQDGNGLYRMVPGLLGNEPDPEHPGKYRPIWSPVPNEREDWAEYDMRGYLDQLEDGEATCASCGVAVHSHAYYAEDSSSEYYCSDCVEID